MTEDPKGEIGSAELARFLAPLLEAGAPDVELDTPLFEMSIDSLTIVEWLYAIEEAYDFEVDQEMVDKLESATVREVIRYVKDATGLADLSHAD